MSQACITIKKMTMAYGDFIIQRDLDFKINQGDIFVIMGGSGCGKSTFDDASDWNDCAIKGSIYYGNENLWGSNASNQRLLLNKTGFFFKAAPY
jgi:phospholipid/cholesterol/gamma-HCH transport system ATP-binding protein